MKVKVDENLPASLARDLVALGHDADAVPAEGLKGRPDADVFAGAQGAERFLVTQDLDFSDLRRFAPGTHHGVLLARVRAPGRTALTERVLSIFAIRVVAPVHRALQSCPAVAGHEKAPRVDGALAARVDKDRVGQDHAALDGVALEHRERLADGTLEAVLGDVDGEVAEHGPEDPAADLGVEHGAELRLGRDLSELGHVDLRWWSAHGGPVAPAARMVARADEGATG